MKVTSTCIHGMMKGQKMALQHKQQQEAIEAIIKSFDSNIVSSIKDIEKLVLTELARQGINETTALNFQTTFNEILANSGYFEKINKLIDDDFDTLFKSIRKGVGEGGFDVLFTENDLSKFAALKQLQLDQFESLGAEAGRQLEQALLKYALSDFSLADAQAQLQRDFAGTNLSKHATTLARTAIGDFQQAVIDIKGAGVGAVWLYVGVDDGITRDFCKCVLNQNHFYTTDQKNLIMSNSLRRFNCRHRARPVSKEFALKNGFTKSTGISCG